MISRKSNRSRYVAVFLLAAAIAHGVSLWHERSRVSAGYGDFSSFYTAGLLLRRGEGRMLYDRSAQWEAQQEFASHVEIRKGPLPFIRPPFWALIFVPLSYFSYPVAIAGWSLAKVFFLWLTARVLPRIPPFTPIYPSWLEVVLCLGLFPVFLDLLVGQDAPLLLLILAVVLNRLHHGRDVVAGMILALGLFRFHLIVPIVLMLWLAGRGRILIGFLPGAAALVALSCAISGVNVLLIYPEYLLRLNRATGAGFVAPASMPNLRGLLTLFLGRTPYPGPIHWLLLPVALAAMVLTARIWKPLVSSGFSGLALGYCLAVLVDILTSYYAYSYDMTLLIIPLLLLGGGFLDQPGLRSVSRGAVAAGLLLVICTPLYWALIIRFDRPYLLVVPMFILTFGIVRLMQQSHAETGGVPLRF
jgi:hypothetical protein